MKNTILFVLLLVPFASFSQYLEVGGSVGGANYLGELASNSSSLNIGETNLAFGAFARFNINHLIGLKVHGQIAKLSGADANSSNREIIDRNLSFQTNISEVGLTAEVNLFGFDPVAGSFSPYLFGGIAYYKFDPEAELDGITYQLQPLGTEGQGRPEHPERTPYELSQYAIPFGVGFKYALSENLHVGLEIGGRKLFTDYLDDVSLTYPTPISGNRADIDISVNNLLSNRSLSGGDKTGLGRGDTNATDWYFVANFMVSYNFLDTGTIGGRRGGRRSKTGCLTF